MKSNFEQYSTPRTVVVNAPAVNGYVAIRLTPLLSQEPGNAQADAVSKAVVTNTSPVTGTIGIQFKQTLAADPASTRTNMGSGQSVVAGGFAEFDITPSQKYVELWITSGSGSLRIELTGRIIFSIESFARNDTNYPTKLWRA